MWDAIYQTKVIDPRSHISHPKSEFPLYLGDKGLVKNTSLHFGAFRIAQTMSSLEI
jgi:hypothetical protein